MTRLHRPRKSSVVRTSHNTNVTHTATGTAECLTCGGTSAILSFYADWLILASATTVTLLDRLLSGIFFPLSLPGIAQTSIWFWTEHGLWLIVCVLFLLWSARQRLANHKRPDKRPKLEQGLSGTSDDRQQTLAGKLQRALTDGGLSLVYQPIFRDDGRMVAVEALARWRDLQEGVISPAEFIPMAEATGLIVPLSGWILREACEQMVQWTAIEPHLERLAVNVSVKHIWQADFVQTVERILSETGLPPQRLELEVTESALVTDFDTVKQHLTALRRLGVRISIDDFGTGYSSLSRVRELDADILKVDRLFVQGASETPNGVAVVQAIIDMAHSLKLSVIAEGVETPEQMSMLRTMHCDEMQGFLLARPQAPELITATLRDALSADTCNQQLRLVPKPA